MTIYALNIFKDFIAFSEVRTFIYTDIDKLVKVMNETFLFESDDGFKGESEEIETCITEYGSWFYEGRQVSMLIHRVSMSLNFRELLNYVKYYTLNYDWGYATILATSVESLPKLHKLIDDYKISGRKEYDAHDFADYLEEKGYQAMILDTRKTVKY